MARISNYIGTKTKNNLPGGEDFANEYWVGLEERELPKCSFCGEEINRGGVWAAEKGKKIFLCRDCSVYITARLLADCLFDTNYEHHITVEKIEEITKEFEVELLKGILHNKLLD